MPDQALPSLLATVHTCTVCAPHLAAGPRPLVQCGRTARIVIIGQAPGARAHASGVPWDDASGVRLRDWTGLDAATFYDPDQVAIVPMGFCYPGRRKGGDLPPRPECAPLWHDRLLAELPEVRLTLLVGGYAQHRYLPAMRRESLTEVVRRFGELDPGTLPLPHPAWRSSHWMARNPWFEADLLPVLRDRIAAALAA